MFILNGTVSGGIKKYRVDDPHVSLFENLDVDLTFGNLNDLNEDTNEKLFVHFSVFTNQQALNFINGLQKNGKKIIVDVDDYWEVPKNHFLYKRNIQTKFTETFISQIKKADGVVCSTSKLSESLRKYNSNVIVIPNCLDFDKESKHRSYVNNSKYTVGWAGGSSHVDDIRIMSKIGILSEMKDVRFILAGFDNRLGEGEQNLLNEGVWSAYENIITNKYNLINDKKYVAWLKKFDKHHQYFNIEQQNYVRRWSENVRKYLKSISDFDVFLVPLKDDIYSRHKSELKLLEASLHRIPVVCSNVQQYTNIIEKSQGGFAVDNKRAHKDFIKYLKLLQDHTIRTDMGNQLYKYMSENFELKHWDHKRKEYYDSI